MPQPAHGQLPPTTPTRSSGGVGRLVRLGLIGLVILPFVLGTELGLVASTQSITVEASADSQILSNFPDRNYGAGVRLRSQAKNHANQRTLIRFSLPKFTGAVKSVQLRLFVRNWSDGGGSVREVLGPWAEKSVTWLKAPVLAPKAIGSVGSTGRAGSWVSVPIRLAGLKAGATVDLAIVGASGNGALYASRETGNGPKLVLTLDTASAAKPTSTAASNPTSKPPAKPATGPTSAPTSAPGGGQVAPPRPGTSPRADPGRRPAPGRSSVRPAGSTSRVAAGGRRPASASTSTAASTSRSASRPAARLSGKVPFLLHVQLRDNPAVITLLRVAIADSGGNSNGFAQSVRLSPGADGYGEWYIPALVDTTVRGHDGWQEFRFTANMSSDPDGKRQYQSTGLQANIQNGHGAQSAYRRNPWWEARGWYAPTGYTNARLFQIPPTAPVSGSWPVRWACSPSGSPATYHAAYVDADTHAIPMKLPHVYSEGSGAFNGTTNIDTSALSNGLHKLLLRCDARVSSGTDSGLLQVLFRVAN